MIMQELIPANGVHWFGLSMPFSGGIFKLRSAVKSQDVSIWRLVERFTKDPPKDEPLDPSFSAFVHLEKRKRTLCGLYPPPLRRGSTLKPMVNFSMELIALRLNEQLSYHASLSNMDRETLPGLWQDVERLAIQNPLCSNTRHDVSLLQCPCDTQWGLMTTTALKKPPSVLDAQRILGYAAEHHINHVGEFCRTIPEATWDAREHPIFKSPVDMEAPLLPRHLMDVKAFDHNDIRAFHMVCPKETAFFLDLAPKIREFYIVYEIVRMKDPNICQWPDCRYIDDELDQRPLHKTLVPVDVLRKSRLSTDGKCLPYHSCPFVFAISSLVDISYILTGQLKEDETRTRFKDQRRTLVEVRPEDDIGHMDEFFNLFPYFRICLAMAPPHGPGWSIQRASDIKFGVLISDDIPIDAA